MLTSSSNANEIHRNCITHGPLAILRRGSRRKPKETKHLKLRRDWIVLAQVQEMRLPTTLALLILAFVGGNLLMGISFNARSTKNSTDPGYASIELNSRRLKGRYTIRKTRGLENIRTDDYQPIDPTPSTKASIRPGPIEHGTPILPYVPRYPRPPGHPEDMPTAESP